MKAVGELPAEVYGRVRYVQGDHIVFSSFEVTLDAVTRGIPDNEEIEIGLYKLAGTITVRKRFAMQRKVEGEWVDVP